MKLDDEQQYEQAWAGALAARGYSETSSDAASSPYAAALKRNPYRGAKEMAGIAHRAIPAVLGVASLTKTFGVNPSAIRLVRSLTPTFRCAG
jgi:hypothetical protein